MEILSLIKFGQKKHLEDMLLNGTIYCNPIEYFRRLEDSGVRGDSYEGTFNITNLPPNSKIEIVLDSKPEKTFKLNLSSGHIREYYSNLKGNLFCLYCITESDLKKSQRLKIDERNADFGSHFLLIKDLKNIVPRLIDAFENCGFEYTKNLVQYYDRKKRNGKIGPFEKPIEYSYQKEFRFFIQSNSQEPIKLEIGSIENEAQIFEISQLKELEYVQT